MTSIKKLDSSSKSSMSSSDYLRSQLVKPSKPDTKVLSDFEETLEYYYLCLSESPEPVTTMKISSKMYRLLRSHIDHYNNTQPYSCGGI